MGEICIPLASLGLFAYGVFEVAFRLDRSTSEGDGKSGSPLSQRLRFFKELMCGKGNLPRGYSIRAEKK